MAMRIKTPTPISRIKSHSIAYGVRRRKKDGKMGYWAAECRPIAHFPDLFPALPEGRAGPGVGGGRERHNSARKY